MSVSERYTVWVVTFLDAREKPVVTVFKEEADARLYYETFSCAHGRAYMDKYPVYGKFTVGERFPGT